MARQKRTDSDIKHARERAISQISYGPEPDWPDKFFLKEDEIEIQLGKALNWYNFKSKPSDKRSWLMQYLEKEGTPNEIISKVERIPDSVFGIKCIGQLARCFLRGAPLPDKYKEYIFTQVKLHTAEVDKQEASSETVEPKLKARVVWDPDMQKAAAMIEQRLDLYIEDKEDEPYCNFVEVCKTLGLSKQQAITIAERFQGRAKEIEMARNGDAFWKEAYGNYTKPALKEMQLYFSGLLDQANEVVRVKAAKATSTKTRKTRVKTPTQLVKKVLKQEEYKVAGKSFKSIEPEGIIGAKQLWIFNTRYRRLGCFYSKDDKGLSIKGTRVQNFDETNCWNKKLREKAIPEILPRLMLAREAGLRSFMDNISSSPRKQKPRLNDFTVILRAIK